MKRINIYLKNMTTAAITAETLNTQTLQNLKEDLEDYKDYSPNCDKQQRNMVNEALRKVKGELKRRGIAA